jgi:hypothetical protein
MGAAVGARLGGVAGERVISASAMAKGQAASYPTDASFGRISSRKFR